jgi:hypothetical protein
MSPLIYLIKTYPINFTNIFIGTLIKNAGTKVYNPCQYNLVNTQFIEVTIGDLANSLSLNPKSEFRNVQWNNSIDLLDQHLSNASSAGQILIFGSNHNQQLELLKSHYKDQCFTIGLTYNESVYQLLLKNMSQYHVYMLTHNKLTPTQLDLECLDQLSQSQLEDYYIRAFDQLSLIPHSSSTDCDYNLPVTDLFSLEKLKTHYNNIGMPFTDESLRFYQSWALASA